MGVRLAFPSGNPRALVTSKENSAGTGAMHDV